MLKYLEHTQDCWTERTQFFRDDEEGDLVYDSYEGTTVERTDEGLRIKVRIIKDMNWMQIADQLTCEVRQLTAYARQWQRERKTFADMEVIERDPYLTKQSQEEYLTDHDTFQYMYFYDELNWVMYESDDFYMFVFDQSNDNYFLGAKGMAGLAFTPQDCLCGICSWLRRWYDRVNGYPEEQS